MKSKEFCIDREALQELVGTNVSRDASPFEVLENIKGREVEMFVYDERFEKLTIRGVVSKLKDAGKNHAKLFVENWEGVRQPEPWAIKILEINPPKSLGREGPW